MIINLLITIWILLIPTCLTYHHPFSQFGDNDENSSPSYNNHNGGFSNVHGSRSSLYGSLSQSSPFSRSNQGRLLLERAQSSPLASSAVKSSDHYNHKWRPKSYICNKSMPLGMQSGAIKNDQLTASSTYNEQSVGPRFARFGKDESGGAWCPKAQLNQDTSGNEWIQVNLTDRYVITSVATQGRFGNGNGREYLEEYFIEYSRDFGVSWTRWKTSKGQTHLKGNNDTYSNVTNILDLPIVGANMIRLFPFAKHYRTVCLRFELFGCPYKDGPLSYSMPDGAFGGRYGDLIDDSYDGIRDQRKYLSRGLGQLVDGIKAHEDYKVNSGYEWIGWEAGNETVEIVFEFGELRNFSSVMLFTHNLFSKHIEVFSSARIYFSFDGARWSKSPLTMEYQPDHITESPRDVIINLGNKVSKFIKFSLKFASKLLLISEVKFNSFPVSGDYNQLMDDLESLEVTQDPVEPDDQGGPSMLSIFIIIFSLILLVSVAIGSFILYRRYFHGRNKTDHFLTIGTNYLDSIGDPCKGATTPVYCDPDEINNYHRGGGGNHHPHHLLLQQQQLTTLLHQQNHQQLRYDHEYAVPDVCNYPNGNSSVNNKTTKHLISNPLSNLDKFVKETNYVNYSKHNNVIIGDNNSCDYNDLKPLADKSDHEPTLIKVNSGTTLINGLANSTSVNNSVVLPPPPPSNQITTDADDEDEDDDDDQDVDHPSNVINPLIDVNHMYLLKQNNHHHQPSPNHHQHHHQLSSSNSSSPNNLTTSTTTNSPSSPSPKYGTITTATQRFLTSSNVNKQRQGYRAVAMSSTGRRGDRR
ncbi:uncharacterized protein LOC128393553 [Panonychus citri]|uniref:uncharacterized protein LOC128393553 n=1 Tax=Panonychus citri TaxID=50023 RepID=UPI002307CDE5|nr:uncharacterized protein LOC128393553 [Panonychus citri]